MFTGLFYVVLVMACLYGITPGERTEWIGCTIGVWLVWCMLRCTPELILAQISGDHATTWGDVMYIVGPHSLNAAIVVGTVALILRLAVMVTWSMAPYKRY